MSRFYSIIGIAYSNVGHKKCSIVYFCTVFALVSMYCIVAVAQNITVPKDCRLDCEEQFRFIASIDSNATRDDFIKIFGREHRRVPYNSGESIHVFKSSFGVVISVFVKSRLEAVSIWPGNNKNHVSPIPGSHQTLSEQRYANLRKCGIRTRALDLRIIEDRLRAFAISKACKTTAKGFSRQVYVYQTAECPFSETEILRSCPNSLQPSGVIVSTRRVQGRTYGSLGVDVDYWIATCYGNTVNC